MEVKEEEAKICRLCGQTDNICIDVFSEDGTNRLLRIKIHSKINILIEENDELPTGVCVKCIGALEFLCDFYDWCHRTQQSFNDQLKNNFDTCENSENESDKENISPEQKSKRKLKFKSSTIIIEHEKNFNKNDSNENEKLLISQQEIIDIDFEKENCSTILTKPTEIITNYNNEISQIHDNQVYFNLENIIVNQKNLSTTTSANVINENFDKKNQLTNDNNNKNNNKKLIEPTLEVWLKSGNAMNKKRKIDDNNQSQIEKKKLPRICESRYSKISELMTDEQKETVENYYRVDMTVVDENKVAENMTIYSRNEIECKICRQKYNRMDKCQVHIWRHLEMKPYLCTACDFTTLTVSNIRCHIRKSHLKIKPYVCPLCEKQYTSPSSLQEHLNTHTGEKPYRCDECDFSSASKQVLSYHKLTHKQEKDVECDVCGKKFYSKGRLRSHKFIHNKDTSFKCKFCSTYFMNKEALEKHYSTSHVQDYECNICNKTYKSRKSLHNHQNVHSEAKYQCSLCPRRYKSQHILKEHLLKHGGIRKYKCKTCEKTFAQQSHLSAHMSVHKGFRFECPGCKKWFNRHDNMKAHTKRCSKILDDPTLMELVANNTKMKTESCSSIDNMSVSSKSSSVTSVKIIPMNVTTKMEKNVNMENYNNDNDDNDNDEEEEEEEEESDGEYHYGNNDNNSRKTSEILHSLAESDDDDDDDNDDNDDMNDNRNEDIINRGELSVTENILSPECF